MVRILQAYIDPSELQSHATADQIPIHIVPRLIRKLGNVVGPENDPSWMQVIGWAMLPACMSGANRGDENEKDGVGEEQRPEAGEPHAARRAAALAMRPRLVTMLDVGGSQPSSADSSPSPITPISTLPSATATFENMTEMDLTREKAQWHEEQPKEDS